MTNGEIKIEVISELTGDPKEKVASVVNLMREVLGDLVNKELDTELTPREADNFRRNLKNDNELITWYKQGLHHYAVWHSTN